MEKFSSDAIFIDVSGDVACPLCRCQGQLGQLTYCVHPPLHLMYEENGVEKIICCGRLRDYACKNCGGSFLIEEEVIKELRQ
jgi:hypothetical protein